MGQRTCSVEDCSRPHSGKGYCAVHYQHWLRWGDPLYYAPSRSKTGCKFPDCKGKHDARGYCSAHAKQLARGEELRPLRPFYNGAPCSAEGCDEPVIARGWCTKHYGAWNRYGDPLIVRAVRIPGGSASTRQRRLGPNLSPHRRGGPRKWALNEHYFDQIDTPEKAYWLGFITADGCIMRRGKKVYVMSVTVAGRDRDHMQLLSDCLNYTKPLEILRRNGQARVVVHSWRMVEALERLGLTPRKSFTAEPWDGPATLMPHYWRGLFDGDGCIYHGRTTPSWTLAICGSEACVRTFASWAHDICGSVAKPRPHKKSPQCWVWIVSGSHMPQLLAQSLYEDATVGLTRKHELARELLAARFSDNRRRAHTKRTQGS